MNTLKWKKGLPTQPGWYWLRTLERDTDGSAYYETEIVHVRLYVRELAIGNSTLKGWKAMEEAEWAGPIPEPDNLPDFGPNPLDDAV